MPAKAVLFDLGNTLVSYYRKEDFLPVLSDSINRSQEFLVSRQLPCDSAVALEKAITQDRGREDHRVTPIEERLSAIFGDPAVQPLMPELVRVFMEPIFATAQILDGAIELLTVLQARHIPLVLVSNTPWGSPSGQG